MNIAPLNTITLNGRRRSHPAARRDPSLWARLNTITLNGRRRRASVAEVAETIEKAVALRFRSDPRSAFVDGGISYGDIADDFRDQDPDLYVVFVDNGGVSRRWTTAPAGAIGPLGTPLGAPSVTRTFRFFCHGNNAWDGRRMRDLIFDLFNPLSPALSWTRGVTTVMVPSDEGHDPQTYTDTRGEMVSLAYIDVKFTFDRYPSP